MVITFVSCLKKIFVPPPSPALGGEDIPLCFIVRLFLKFYLFLEKGGGWERGRET